MTTLENAIAEYVALRRTLGYALRVEAGILRRFGAFAKHHRATHITSALVLQWAEQMHANAPGTTARAVSVVRKFAAWHAADDERTEVPPKRLVRGGKRRAVPFLHTDEQLMALVEAARGLEGRNGLRGPTFSTVFAFLSVTGMRLCEIIKLDRADVDLRLGVVRVTNTKFGKSRFVPLHETTRRALIHYAKIRDRVVPYCDSPAFFIAESGKRLADSDLRTGFVVASCRVGQRATYAKPCGKYRKRGRGPRIHDLRHRFAVRTLIDWYRAGKDVEREIPKLSTYLGHNGVTTTYWYIEAAPELLHLATARIAYSRGGSGP